MTNKPALMTEAEIHDFGIGLVYDFLKKDGYEILSANTEVGTNPQLIAKSDGQLKFIIVRTDCYPSKGAIESEEVAMQCIDQADASGAICYFASVGIANTHGKGEEDLSIPIRGAGFMVSFDGVVMLTRSDRVRVAPKFKV